MEESKDGKALDDDHEAAQSHSLVRTKLNEMQESVEVYERLGLKSEYLYAYRMLIFLILQAGDFNALAREFNKFVGESVSKAEA